MASRDPARPNVLFVISDDQGAWALGCGGNREIRTPVLDALAAKGIRFDNFFCTSPVCSPSRASLLTGDIPSRHGVHDWIRQGSMPPARIDYLAGQTLITDVAAAAGYRVALIGKWHLGASDVPRPSYVKWFAHQSGMGPYYDAPMVDTNSVPVNRAGLHHRRARRCGRRVRPRRGRAARAVLSQSHVHGPALSVDRQPSEGLHRSGTRIARSRPVRWNRRTPGSSAARPPRIAGRRSASRASSGTSPP